MAKTDRTAVKRQLLFSRMEKARQEHPPDWWHDREREFLKILEIQKNRSMGEKAYIKACSAHLISDWRDYMIEHLRLNNRIRRVRPGVGHRIELVDDHLAS